MSGLLPTLTAHEELVRLAQRRVLRARARREAAQAEETEAVEALDAAVRNRAEWIATNPDPQLMML